ncbi:radical SAM protein [Abyssisolibacter fermentans]|uniref:radical SAM protein n=1 Tax=Abyssisolibacter fermentans TaxID=1766203 RepID=UPI000831C7D0|nr:radical SAM protein [Abyssisolibacter fermentans]
MKNLSEKMQEFGLKKAISYLNSDPDQNIPKLLNWLEKFDKDGYYKTAYNSTRKAISEHNNWYKLIKSLYTDIDDGVREKIFENFIINASILGVKRQNKSRKEYDCNVPWAILMDPTSACNLHCTGCWSAEYGDKLSMDFDTLDSIIKQGKELGTYMYIYSGGEPLIRKKDIIKLCEKHNDCIFLAFTNATLIDQKFADEMLRVKNFVPAISVEGFEEETDMRRGKGTYKAVIKAMEILKKNKLLFGFSTCYHSKNAEVIGSEEYFDKMIAQGCKFGWIFTYMPVGCDAVHELIATAEQREYMYHQVRGFRKTKPLFTLDFWNDGDYIDGCIAGGRIYLHINANGDVEPCAFIHYSNSNIKECTLLDALRSPLFMQYKQNQPFNDNHLIPCPLLDNPGILADMVEKSNAQSTEILNPENVRDLSAKCLNAANKWAPVATKLWECSQGCYQNND